MKNTRNILFISVVVALAIGLLAAFLYVQTMDQSSSEEFTVNSFNQKDDSSLEEGQEEVPVEAEGAMRRYFVTDAANRKALCNDGSDAAYFFRPGEESDKWVIWFEGGGVCHDEETCAERAEIQPWLMTSNKTGEYAQQGGILSPSKEDNTDFADWNHVMLNYCSSDLWLGDAVQNIEGNEVLFYGTHIVEAIFQDLGNPDLHNQNLSTAEEVIIAGTSAGGAGASQNMNRIVQWIPHAQVMGVIDSSWEVDFPSLTRTEEELEEFALDSMNFQNLQLDSSCVADLGDDSTACTKLPNVYDYWTVPVFIYIDQYDKKKLTTLFDVTDPRDPDQRAFMDDHAAAIRESLVGITGVFSPQKTWHGTINNNKFFRETINGMSFSETFSNWYFENDGPVTLIK